MKILCFGSLNIDRVYQVDNFVSAGETISALDFHLFSGGKGLNQSIALSRAGGDTYHAGCVGPDGAFLIQELEKAGVHTEWVQSVEDATGHAVIQVNCEGQNCIIVSPGANCKVSKEQIDHVLAQFSSGDILLIQNEINNIPYLMEQAKKRGLWIVFNPSPITRELDNYPMQYVNLFILNEIEGAHLSHETDNSLIVAELSRRYPGVKTLLTLGSEGCYYQDGEQTLIHGIFPAQVVDTTAAGDTFCGYFVACLSRGMAAQESIRYATAAASIAVSKMGASSSIPALCQVEAFLKDQ